MIMHIVSIIIILCTVLFHCMSILVFTRCFTILSFSYATVPSKMTQIERTGKKVDFFMYHVLNQ